MSKDIVTEQDFIILKAREQGDYETLLNLSLKDSALRYPVEFGRQVPSTPLPEFTVNAQGGKKQTGGKESYNQVPEAFVAALSKHMDIGARKYGFGNHAKGMSESQILEATRRHYNKRRKGENNDAETGSSHYLAIAANAMMAWSLEQAGRLKDDRKGFYIDMEYSDAGK